jgi:hypothetical protein
MAGKHAKVSPAAEPQSFRVPWQSAIGNDQSVIAAVFVLFVVESQRIPVLYGEDARFVLEVALWLSQSCNVTFHGMHG